jgi:hypothetical protein
MRGETPVNGGSEARRRRGVSAKVVDEVVGQRFSRVCSVLVGGLITGPSDTPSTIDQHTDISLVRAFIFVL